jgi:hypothetical protein
MVREQSFTVEERSSTEVYEGYAGAVIEILRCKKLLKRHSIAKCLGDRLGFSWKCIVFSLATSYLCSSLFDNSKRG